MIARTVLTYDQLQAVPEDGLRRELLGGDLYVTPAPSPVHQRVVGRVYMVLDAYARSRGGEALVSPVDVVFASTDAVQPDVLYIEAERLSIIGPKNIQGAPSLVVEVVSPSSSDVDPGPKLELYARYCVPEYWIVEPGSDTITAYARPSAARYAETRVSTDGCIEAITLAELRFSLKP
ncbi:MAG: Uma2 family endonuclease [Vulcanimicrobiaceae bacterium]